jgi:type I restriction enzyme S subunit
MIEDLKPYPEYKDSGLPWLGEVPAHWTVLRIKTVLQETDRRSQEGTETLLSLTRIRGLIPHRDMTKKMHGAKTLVGYKKYRAGQLVMNRMQAWSGMFGANENNGLVSPDYAVFDVLGKHSVRFILERIKSPDLVGQFALESKGIGSGFNRLYTDRFGQIAISLPTPSEQTAIARFLAWATNRLDRAIGAKCRIITLLQEQKQAIIHRAVTRGLDPSVPLKDSGIPWLGEIPERWEVRRLRTVVKTIDQGVSPLSTGFMAVGNSWGVLKSGCVNRGVFRETEHKQLSQSFKIDSSIVVKPGDVLISRACGSPSLVGSVGRVGKLHDNLILSDKTFRPNFEESVDVGFMVLAMNSSYYRRQVEQAISGAEGMANNLPLSSLRDFSLAIPPLNEAKAIACSIEKRLAGTYVAIASNEKEITLLREYRTRLITDVVTGKLDVREVAKGLQEEELQDQPDVAAGYDADEAEDDSDSDPIDTEED